ncbi:reverse transcriptase domain-containing protein [Tanacetum coccineum]
MFGTPSFDSRTLFVYVSEESRRASSLDGIHPGIHNRRVGSDTLRKRRSLAKRRHERHAALQVVLTLKAQPDSASDLLSGGSPHRCIMCQVSGQRSMTSSTRYHTCSSGRGKLRKPEGYQNRKLLQQIGAIRGTRLLNYQEFRMTGPTSDPTTPVNRTDTNNPNDPPNLQEQILNHISSLKALVQLHNESPTGSIRPIRLSVEDEERSEEKHDEEPKDLRKPYKEVLKSPFSRRIIEFSASNHRTPTNLKIYDGLTDPDDQITWFVGAANQGEWEMPMWCRMFQQTLDRPTKGWFDRLPNGCIDNWTDLREAFMEMFTLRRKCCKDPIEVFKIVRKAKETLPDFKEGWIEEMSYIPDVPIVMQISSFMSNSKCLELARRFSDKVQNTVIEMMKRVDNFMNSEEVFKNTKLPKGEYPEKVTATQFRRSRPPRHSYVNGPPRTEVHHRRDPINHTCLRQRRMEDITIEDMITEGKRYCEYHGEKGHYINDYFHLKKQLEVALESGKLNHLIKDVRQRRNNRGRPTGSNNGRGRVINMVHKNGKDLKRKSPYKQHEEWMSMPITFPPVMDDDVSDGPLIVEAEVEGYWVRRVFIDQGAAVQVMFEHCFDHMSPNIKARLTPTQTELVGFSGEQLIPIWKIELEVQSGGGGLTRKVMMKFTVVRASSPYNIILGRTGLQELRAVSSTVHAMLKFPTPKGIATLCARTELVYECLWSERKTTKQEATKEKAEGHKAPVPKGEEKILVNPEQAITIGTQFSTKCREQLIRLLKDNMDVFAWQSSDMAGVPRRLTMHALNVNNSVPPVAQKRKVLGTEKSKVVTREVEEWVKAGIVKLVKYPTWISNPVLVKKANDTWRMFEAVMGHPFKCFLDAYKGYHQVQMSEEDEEKTSFYTDQGIYCYVKMPFGPKNVGAIYQWLVDSAFQAQLGRNLEAYVDDMVIKSKTEQEMIADIAETFDNLRKINMKLNPMKCSFGAGEGKFLGYMVTSDGIRVNPKKTKAIADMESAKTLKEMQILSGKLAALN